MKSLFGDSILKIKTSVNGDAYTQLLVSPEGGNKDPSSLLKSIHRAIQAVTITKNENTATWSKSIASIVGFVSLNYPYNSAYCATSFDVPSTDEILKTGGQCFQFVIKPSEWVCESDWANPKSFVIEISDLRTGSIVFSGIPDKDAIKELERKFNIAFESL